MSIHFWGIPYIFGRAVYLCCFPLIFLIIPSVHWHWCPLLYSNGQALTSKVQNPVPVLFSEMSSLLTSVTLGSLYFSLFFLHFIAPLSTSPLFSSLSSYSFYSSTTQPSVIKPPPLPPRVSPLPYGQITVRHSMPSISWGLVHCSFWKLLWSIVPRETRFMGFTLEGNAEFQETVDLQRN